MATEGNSGTASGGQLEERTDFTIETDLALAQCASLLENTTTDGSSSSSSSSSTVLSDALNLLYALEKRCRVGNDHKNLVRVCTAAVQACYDTYHTNSSSSRTTTTNTTNSNATLISTIVALCTKRSQKVAAIRAIVTTALPWCIVISVGGADVGGTSATTNNATTTTRTTTTTMNFTPIAVSNESEKQNRNDLIQCLRTITDGKLFLERERAQLTRAFAAIKEEEGDIASAADVLQEVHVETYGSLSKKEKVEYILEQLRLTICKQDYVRAAIVAGKINRKHLSEMPSYKIQFYTLLSTIHRHDKNELELIKDYHAIYLTHVVQQRQGIKSAKNETKNDDDDVMMEQDTDPTSSSSSAPIWTNAMKAVVIFILLAPYSNEQQDILNHIAIDTNLEKLPSYQAIVQLLLKKEIIQYPIPDLEEIEAMPVFIEDGLQSYWHDVLYRRIIQHNIRIVALYYTRIHGKRLGQLLHLSPDVLEEEIATMVSDGTIYAKMDRPADIIRFQKPLSSETILTNWSSQIEQLLHLVDTTTHLIHKEQMTSNNLSS